MVIICQLVQCSTRWFNGHVVPWSTGSMVNCWFNCHVVHLSTGEKYSPGQLVYNSMFVSLEVFHKSFLVINIFRVRVKLVAIYLAGCC